MKITILTLLAFALSLTLYSFTKPNAKTLSLTIEVKNLRSEKGVVQFALYNKDGSIPDEDYENYYKIVKGEIVMVHQQLLLKIFHQVNMLLTFYTMKTKMAKLTKDLFYR